jgi:predicted Zn-dependent protease
MLDRAAALAPSDFRTALARARLHVAGGEVGPALEAWALTLSTAPPDAALIREAYQFLPVGGHWLDMLTSADARLSVDLATIVREEEGNALLALAAWQQAVALEPETWALHPDHVSAYLHAEAFVEAERLVQEQLAAGFDGPPRWHRLGLALQGQGRHLEAAEAYLNAGTTTDWLLRAVRATEAGGGPDEALKALSRIELERSSRPELGLEAARLHHVAGDSGSCVAEIERRGLLREDKVSRAAKKQLRLCKADR